MLFCIVINSVVIYFVFFCVGVFIVWRLVWFEFDFVCYSFTVLLVCYGCFLFVFGWVNYCLFCLVLGMVVVIYCWFVVFNCGCLF